MRGYRTIETDVIGTPASSKYLLRSLARSSTLVRKVWPVSSARWSYSGLQSAPSSGWKGKRPTRSPKVYSPMISETGESGTRNHLTTHPTAQISIADPKSDWGIVSGARRANAPKQLVVGCSPARRAVKPMSEEYTSIHRG